MPMSEIPPEQSIESIRGWAASSTPLCLPLIGLRCSRTFRATIAISDMENTPLAMISTRMIRISDGGHLELLLPRVLTLRLTS